MSLSDEYLILFSILHISSMYCYIFFCLFLQGKNTFLFVAYAGSLLQVGVHVLAINYGSPGVCQYPRPLKFVSALRSYCCHFGIPALFSL